MSRWGRSGKFEKLIRDRFLLVDLIKGANRDVGEWCKFLISSYLYDISRKPKKLMYQDWSSNLECRGPPCWAWMRLLARCTTLLSFFLHADVEAKETGLLEYSKLKKASVEALRYRAEDIGRSLTSRAVQEVALLGPISDNMLHYITSKFSCNRQEWCPYRVRIVHPTLKTDTDM